MHLRPQCETVPLPNLIEAFHRHSSEWADRLANASTRQQWKELAYQFVDRVIDQMDVRTDPSDEADEVARQLHQFVASNLHRGPTLKDLAGFLGYSEKYCSVLFETRMGKSFSQYRKQLRLEKAGRMLREGLDTTAAIAGSLGFSDPFAFSHFFKKAVGCSPSRFRNQARSSPLPERPRSLHSQSYNKATTRRQDRRNGRSLKA